MNPPDEVFLKRAAECERMANSLATLRAGFTWKRMAARWQRCARVAADTSSSAAHHEPNRHRKPAPGWARH
jgi:hypothetical protein